MKKDRVIRFIGFIFIILLILSIINFISLFFLSKSGIKKITSIPEYNAASIIIFGSSEDTVSAKINFYDVTGNSIATIERSWNSDILYLEFASFKNDDSKKKISVPYRIYSNRTGNLNSGIFLKRYTMKNRNNVIYKGLFKENERKYYNRISNFIYLPSARFFTKSINFTAINLSGCLPGNEYIVRIFSDGTVNLLNLSDK